MYVISEQYKESKEITCTQVEVEMVLVKNGDNEGFRQTKTRNND